MERRSPIDVIEDPGSLSYQRFFQHYLVGNRPCLLSSGFTRSWGSRARWVTADNTPHWGHLLDNFGDATVPVANCDVRAYNANPKELLPLRDYIAYWREHSEGGGRSPRRSLYLKDWHMQREFPHHDAYQTPPYFSSDWLNEYWDAVAQDDYRFVYMGPAGSWTPFHADVLRSYSWSANICGRKKWLLFPPGEEENLRDRHGNLPYDVTSPLLRDPELHPRWPRCRPPLEVTQEAGQIIFVPSGWHHQVYNMLDTISINHNWVNGCNVAAMWRFLQQELASVQREIAEWRDTMEDWDLHCQVMMKSCTGIDYGEFYSLLQIVARRRLEVLARDSPERGEAHHPLFDLRKIAEILTSLTDDPDFQKLDSSKLDPPPQDLLQRLKEATA